MYVSLVSQELEQQMAMLKAEAEKAKAAALEAAKEEVSAQAEAQLAEELEKAKKELEQEADAKVAAVEAERDEFKDLYTQEGQKRRGLHNKLMDMMGNIRVICRIRPVLSTDKASGDEGTDIVTEFNSDTEMVVHKNKNKDKDKGGEGKAKKGDSVKFEFDNVFDMQVRMVGGGR